MNDGDNSQDDVLIPAKRGLRSPPKALTESDMCDSNDPYRANKRSLALVAQFTRIVSRLSPEAIAYWTCYCNDPRRLPRLVEDALELKDVPVTTQREPQLMRRLVEFWKMHHEPTADLLVRTAFKTNTGGRYNYWCNPSALKRKDGFTIPIFDPGCPTEKLFAIFPHNRNKKLFFKCDLAILNAVKVTGPSLVFARNAVEPDAKHRSTVAKVANGLFSPNDTGHWMNMRQYFLLQHFMVHLGLVLEDYYGGGTMFPDQATRMLPLSPTTHPIQVPTMSRYTEFDPRGVTHNTTHNLGQGFIILTKDSTWRPDYGPREVFPIPLRPVKA